MTATRPRAGAYIWASWLAPLLADTSSCVWAVWFRAHYFHRKVSSFDDPTWKIEHDAMVIAARDALRADDFQVNEEDENKFALTNGGITLAGKPDLVAVHEDRVLVLDCKSGSPRRAHRFQVMLYMVVLPCVRPELRGRPIEGIVQYPNEDVFIPAEAVDAEFRQALRTTIHAVGGPTAPPKTPSVYECAFCPIGSQDCPDRVAVAEAVVISDHDLF